MPFAGYKDFADCVAKNQDQENPQAYCAAIQKKAEAKGEKPAEDSPEDDKAVRWLDRDQGIFLGLIVPYSGPIDGDKDLYNTRFSPKTDLALDWFPNGGRPLLYAHGFDEELQTEVIGREIRNWEDSRGRWVEEQLDKAHRYATEIMELVDKGALALSSAAVDHLVRINRATRDVERWPWVESSLVPNPGNPEALIYSVRSADAVMHAPEIAVRIIEDLEALAPEPEPEPEPPQVEDMTTSVTSLVRSLSPSALHDLAVEMGYACREAPAPEDAQDEPMVVITTTAASVRAMSDEDWAALSDEMRERAIEKARHLTT